MDILRAMMNQDSLKELENMSQRLNGVLRGRGVPREDREEAMALADWVPMVDVVETDSEFLLHAELPGVEKKNVKLSIERGVLTLTGQREQDKEGKGIRYHRVERAYGRFARSYTMPELVDEQKLTAEFRNGVLTVHLPKSEKAKPKSIEVQVN
jgi:HSP20 family protein